MPHRIRPSFPGITFAVCATATLLYLWTAGGSAAPRLSDVANALQIIALGGRSTPLVADAGEGWRLLSCHFVHTSAIHLGFNLLVLFVVGGAIEHACRKVDYAALLLWVAVTSSMASLVGTPQVSAGSSGVVFGVLGAAVTFGLHNHDSLAPQVRRYFGTWVLPFLVILFVLGLRNPAIDHASHLGGLCAGLAAGMLLPVDLPAHALASRVAIGSASSRRASVRLGAVVACTLLAILLSPRLVGAGRARVVHLTPDITLSVPARWVATPTRQDAREFSTAGGMVMLEVEVVPGGSEDDPARWYARRKLGGAWVATPRADSNSLLYVCKHDGVAMIRVVEFVSVRGSDRVLAFTFDTPAQWRSKYAETREAVLGSMRHVAPRVE